MALYAQAEDSFSEEWYLVCVWVLSFLAQKLRLPNAPERIDRLGRNDRLLIHRAILHQKPYFKQLIDDIQSDLLSLVRQRSFAERGSIIEVGAGVIPVQDSRSHTVSTDVEFSSDLSCVADAMALPFSNASAAVVIGQNVLHHIPDPNLAFSEFERVLKSGGVVVLVEPYFGWFASLVYPTLFSSEGFDKSLRLGERLFGLDGAAIPNQAMSFKYFEAGVDVDFPHCPNLTIVHQAPLASGLRYLLSGALNFRRVAPLWMLTILRHLERRRFSGFVLRAFAIHWVIVLRKKDTKP